MPWAAVRSFLTVLVLVRAGPATADQPSLGLPIDCTPGEDCWIVSYVDHDPTDGVRDYACGVATYNAPPDNRHKGTDIAIRDRAAMRDGVAVLAAADGVVAGIRDGMADVSVREIGAAVLGGRDCGNGVGIDHGGGWFSQYCHMRKGSISVREGERVAAGQRLGLVGLSGFTEYPHLHIQLAKDEAIIDPFVGRDRSRPCGPGDRPLWRADVLAKLPYAPTAIYNAGFATGAPDPQAMRDGRYRHSTIGRDAPALVLWVDMFNVREGDRVTLRLLSPDGGKAFTNTVTVPKNQARRYVFGGLRRKDSAWPAGTWRGEITLRPREGQPLAATRSIEIR